MNVLIVFYCLLELIRQGESDVFAANDVKELPYMLQYFKDI